MWSEMFHVWSTRRAFKRHRATFYRDLGASLSAGAPLNGLISQYAKYNVPGIGAMMTLWGDGLLASPGSLARATSGLVSEGDTVVISAAEMNPDGAGQLYKMYAANLAQRDAMVRAVTVPLIMPGITFVLLIAVLFFFKNVIYADMLKGVPLKYWPDYGKFAYGVLEFFTGMGGACILCIIVCLLTWVTWSMSNYTGPGRDWLDRKIPPYTVVAQMDLISSLTAICSMIQAGIADTVALNKVASNGSIWLTYQMNKVRAHTARGRPVLTALRDLPLPSMLAARVVVLAGEEKLVDALPELVIQSCQDEALSIVERMHVTGKFVTALSVFVLLGFAGVLALGNVGFAEASQAMSRNANLNSAAGR